MRKLKRPVTGYRIVVVGRRRGEQPDVRENNNKRASIRYARSSLGKCTPGGHANVTRLDDGTLIWQAHLSAARKIVAEEL